MKFLSLYPDAEVMQIPDIVLFTCAEDYGVLPQKRFGVLFCFRSDKEAQMTEENRVFLQQTIASLGKKILYTDTNVENDGICTINRLLLVSTKLTEFASAELVITDRLHGMIFSAISGTPCLAFGNNNYKVSESYKWIKDLPYMKFCPEITCSSENIRELLNMKNCKYDKSILQPYYKKIQDKLLEEFS